MYNQDILELLAHTQNEITSISNQVSGGTVNKVAVKNTLENLRSVLDYSAQDILNKLKSHSNNKLPDKVYFPYGQRDNHFKQSVKRNLPTLVSILPTVYELIESMQPFKSNDRWLVELCGLTNDAKHNNLSKTDHRKSKTIHQGGVAIAEIGEGSQLTMTGCRVNGVLQDDVHIKSDGTTEVKIVSGQTVITDNNKIQFQGKQLEVVPFLKTCHKNLSTFTENLAVELANT